MKRSEVIHPN